MKKNAKGVTLVAMVITIIVMLILAGVSISAVTGDNGVLTRAQQGSVKTNLAAVESAVSLSITSNQTNFMADAVESMASVRETYLTTANLNEYSDGFKLLGAKSDVAANGATSYTFKIKGADSNIRVSASAKFKEGLPLTEACNKTVGDINEYGTSKTDDSSKSKYQTTILYFSDGADGTTMGTNLYAVAVHFEKGFFVIDDVGVIKTKAATTTTLNQGGLYNGTGGEKDKLTALRVEWLKGKNSDNSNL